MSVTEFEQALHLVRAVGHVVETGPGGLLVETDDGRIAARRAVSCLVEPACGDRVLLAGPDPDEVYVLAVLARPGPEPLVLKAVGDLTLAVKDGRFSVLAERGVSLASGEDLSLTGKLLRVRAREGHLALDRLFYTGARILARARRIRLVGRLLDAVMERASLRVKRAYRFVEETDLVRAGEIDQRAEGCVNIRGESAVVFAKKLVKMDAEQIHLG